MELSILVPAYNEEASISMVLKKVLNLDFDGNSWEVIVVDDGSTDQTPHILKRFSDTKNLKVVTHPVNLGKGRALRTGLENSSGSIIAFQDSDSEYDPDQLPTLVKAIRNGESVVYGSRFLGTVEDMSTLFYLGNKILTLSTRILYSFSITDMETGFKVFRREVIEGLNLESKGFDIEPEITAKILRQGLNIKEIPIEYRARDKKEKKITVLDGIRALITLIKYRVR